MQKKFFEGKYKKGIRYGKEFNPTNGKVQFDGNYKYDKI